MQEIFCSAPSLPSGLEGLLGRAPCTSIMCMCAASFWYGTPKGVKSSEWVHAYGASLLKKSSIGAVHSPTWLACSWCNICIPSFICCCCIMPQALIAFHLVPVLQQTWAHLTSCCRKHMASCGTGAIVVLILYYRRRRILQSESAQLPGQRLQPSAICSQGHWAHEFIQLTVTYVAHLKPTCIV